MGFFSHFGLTKKPQHKRGTSFKNRLRTSFIFLSLVVLGVSSLTLLLPRQVSAAPTELDNRITKNLYRNALSVCIGLSSLKDDAFGLVSQRNRINEQNAADYKWFASDSAFAMDVLAGPILKARYGSNTVTASGDVSCGNPAFIIEALKGLGYNAGTGDIDTTFLLMCTIGFRRDGGNNCTTGHGDWYRQPGTTTYDTFMKSSEPRREPLNDGSITANAAKYILGLSTFTAVCKTTDHLTDIPSSNLSDSTGVVVKVFNGATAAADMAMVEHWFTYGASGSRASFSKTATGVGEFYSLGILDPALYIPYPPGAINIGGGVRLNVIAIGQPEFGKLADGIGVNSPCGTLGTNVNKYAGDYLTWAKLNPTQALQQNTQAVTQPEDNRTSCSIDGIGWLLCPLANAAAGLTDALFSAVKAFLNVAPVNLSPTNNPLYSAWATMRTIANVAFVIVFLIIIFSQLSSIGISNYGVKKMLPRLVIAAILVNLSFYISAVAIDISNIAGTSLQDVFKYISEQTTDTLFDAGDNWASITTSILSGIGTIAIGGVALSAVTSGGVWAAVAGLLPLLFGALFALIVAFLVLLARQAIIIMLVVLAPLAFVAFLLPNTESLFKKWRDLFISMLALFPMMAIVFGGSQLAAVILRESSKSLLGHTDDASQMTAFFLYIGSFAVQAIPFFITPVLIKLSSGVLGRFAGLINNPNKGPIDRARKWAEGKADNARNAGYKRKLDARRTHNEDGTLRQMTRREKVAKALTLGAGLKSERDKVSESLKNEAKRSETGYIAEKTTASAGLRRRMAGSNDAGAMQRIQARALEAQQAQRTEDTNAGNAILEELNLSGAQRQELALTGKTTRTNPETKKSEVYHASEALQKAALNRQMTTGSYIEKREIMEGSAAGGSVAKFAQLIASQAAASSGLAATDPALAGRRIDDVTQGRFNYDDAVFQAFKEGKYTSEAIAVMHNDARQELLRVALQQDAAGNPSMLKSLKEAAQGIEDSPEIKGKVAGNEAARQDLAAIAGGKDQVAKLVQERIQRQQTNAFQTYADEGNIEGISPVPSPISPDTENPQDAYRTSRLVPIEPAAPTGPAPVDIPVSDVPISTTTVPSSQPLVPSSPSTEPYSPTNPPPTPSPTSIPPTPPSNTPDYFGSQTPRPPASEITQEYLDSLPKPPPPPDINPPK